MSFEIQFWISLPPVPGGLRQQVRLENLSPASLYQAYLAQSHLNCCSFQGGYVMLLNGQAWNAETERGKTEYCLDEFWMSVSWLAGLKRILAGEPQVRTPYWEESQAGITRSSATQLEIVDRHASGQMLYPPFQVGLSDFYLQLYQATQAYLDFYHAFEKELAIQGCSAALRKTFVTELQIAEFTQALNELQQHWAQYNSQAQRL